MLINCFPKNPSIGCEHCGNSDSYRETHHGYAIMLKISLFEGALANNQVSRVMPGISPKNQDLV
jgi:hypothetical protein